MKIKRSRTEVPATNPEQNQVPGLESVAATDDELTMPKFDPEKAHKLRAEYGSEHTVTKTEQEPLLAEQFKVDPAEYPIFSKQGGVRDNPLTGATEARQLSINETLGLMVGRTAETIANLIGEEHGTPAADHVIYLDKSARPVSWLVNKFWEDFTDKPRPKESFLAIDRRPWFEIADIKLTGNEYFRTADGSLKLAEAGDFAMAFEKLTKDRQIDYLSRIRALYIKDGIESKDPSVIMATPTILDGKNLTIIDEVSRSGATIGIATYLMQQAIPELASVNRHIFWSDHSRANGDKKESRAYSSSDEMQMGLTPVWYPQDSSDWRGRGVMDVNPEYYIKQYIAEPNNFTRAQKYGAIVLGEPMNKELEPGQPSKKLEEEMDRMHRDYRDGHILPTVPLHAGAVTERMIDQLEGMGVVFTRDDNANKNNYRNLIRERDKI